jgi:molybdopterin-guanine dinucleotide biosynthesis protein A
LIAAVVLAGGQSRRFGADKLQQVVDGRRLLDLALSHLPAGTSVVVVGPEAQGGPAAALIVGLRRALALGPEAIVVLPGDAPEAGGAAAVLLAELVRSGVGAVVAVDPDGREQPLQLALRPPAAEALIAAAGPSAAVDGSARALISVLKPTRHSLTAAAVFDIDTPDQLRTWELRTSPAVEQILGLLAQEKSGKTADSGASVDATFPDFSSPGGTSPGGTSPGLGVALDGPGAGGLAGAVALRTRCVVVESELFYNPELGLESPPGDWTDADIAGRVIEWRRLRTEALEPLCAGRPAGFAPFDWGAYDGSLGRPRVVHPAPVIVLEGVYSARPELADLVDLNIYARATPAERRTRLDARSTHALEWREFWERGEQHYFTRVRPPRSFDLRV